MPFVIFLDFLFSRQTLHMLRGTLALPSLKALLPGKKRRQHFERGSNKPERRNNMYCILIFTNKNDDTLSSLHSRTRLPPPGEPRFSPLEGPRASFRRARLPPPPREYACARHSWALPLKAGTGRGRWGPSRCSLTHSPLPSGRGRSAAVGGGKGRGGLTPSFPGGSFPC